MTDTNDNPSVPFERGNRGMIKATADNVYLAVSRPDVCGVHLRVVGAHRQVLQFAPARTPDVWYVFSFSHFVGLLNVLKDLGFRPVTDAMLRKAITLVAGGDCCPKRRSVRTLRRMQTLRSS